MGVPQVIGKRYGQVLGMREVPLNRPSMIRRDICGAIYLSIEHAPGAPLRVDECPTVAASEPPTS